MDFATAISQLFIIFGGVIPYIPQYASIANSNSVVGFSTLVTFILILSNSLRIVYWLGHYFDEALLVQSVIMIVAMFVILELCCRVQRNTEHSPEKTFLDFNPLDFWRWTDLSSYIQATVLIWALALGVLFAFFDNEFVVEGIGYAALGIESCLAIPQFVRNFQNGSTQGMNVWMVLLWGLGDSFKGYFYIWKQQPLPFILCAATQLALDALILLQVAIY